MKLLLTMFENSFGISAKTGNSYNMASVQAHLPAQSFKKEGYTRNVKGFEPVPIEINESVIPKLEAMTFPCLAEVTTDTKINRVNGKNVAVMVIAGVTEWAPLVPQVNKA